MNFQQLILALQSFWAQQGCILGQPYDTEKGAGTANPHTFLRCLGPEPWNVAYVEPCRRPTDGRYGENPNRLGAYYQFQVILKPSPKDVVDKYLRSLTAIGIKPREHDIRFVEDDWEQPTLGAWGLGWEVWLDGMEVTQFTYFQQVGGIECKPVCAELTYGIERIAMYLQGVDSIFDLDWGGGFTYRDVHQQTEVEWSKYNFEHADAAVLFRLFDDHYNEANRLAQLGLVFPSYDNALKCSHLFNTLDARGAISVSERAAYIGRIRDLARLSAETFVAEREKLGFPILARMRRAAHAGTAPGSVLPTDDSDPAGETIEATKAVRSIQPTQLLLELGSEEIPARMLAGAAAAFRDRTLKLLTEAGVDHGAARVAWTPRRLVLAVDDVAPVSAQAEELVTGPPVRIAFDDTGAPKVPAIKFAEGLGLTVDDLERVETKKGEYLAARKTTGGEATTTLLEAGLPAVLANLNWPKSMRWGNRDERYVRPLHWIVALYGESQLRFSWAGVASGNLTWGHRFFGNESFAVWSYETLVDGLSRRHVTLEPDARKAAIARQLDDVAASLGGAVVPDGTLLDVVTGLVEAPRVVAGSFDDAFLDLPREVIQTVLTEHQKMFVVEGPDGRLLPWFLGVSNNPVEDQPNTRAGYEKVAVARLKDGVFFWDNDRGKPLSEHGEGLDRITFLRGGGTLGDKSRRLVDLTRALGGDDAAARAALLCKADLVTDVVGEFPKLQGVMGRIYAALGGEPEAVSAAIFEHYLPRGGDDVLPATRTGALVALADKADTLAVCFRLGKKPTGSADPFGLRRAAIGILRILDSGVVDVSLGTLVDHALDGSDGIGDRARDDVRSDLLGYFRTRLKGLWTSAGHGTDVAEAVLAAGFDDVPDGRARLAALTDLRGASEFADLMVSFKRMGNIVRKAGDDASGGDVDAGLLEDGAERGLYDAFVDLRSGVDVAIDAGDHGAALGAMASLRAPLATFFDDVMVMADDADVRRNRLALLTSISGTFSRIADFSAISTE